MDYWITPEGRLAASTGVGFASVAAALWAALNYWITPEEGLAAGVRQQVFVNVLTRIVLHCRG